jgi:hypothetical protein
MAWSRYSIKRIAHPEFSVGDPFGFEEAPHKNSGSTFPQPLSTKSPGMSFLTAIFTFL